MIQFLSIQYLVSAAKWSGLILSWCYLYVYMNGSKVPFAGLVRTLNCSSLKVITYDPTEVFMNKSFLTKLSHISWPCMTDSNVKQICQSALFNSIPWKEGSKPVHFTEVTRDVVVFIFEAKLWPITNAISQARPLCWHLSRQLKSLSHLFETLFVIRTIPFLSPAAFEWLNGLESSFLLGLNN